MVVQDQRIQSLRRQEVRRQFQTQLDLQIKVLNLLAGIQIGTALAEQNIL
jgi:hypothetical protein